ncbi:MAG: hypothetical protein M1828_002564 [Chrysothrix sp. TS-e1954]|nr:MAG: hypothetical protein M1828_002564 [Chrysothrix sp. TS-e1954]
MPTPSTAASEPDPETKKLPPDNLSPSNETNPQTPSPIYFWREHETPHGYLSQWYPCTFTSTSHKNITYTSTEQYMMHLKSLQFSDHPTAAAILATPSPAQQRSLGRQVKGYDGQVWERVRADVVREGNRLKFSQGVTRRGDVNGEGVRLGRLLVGTGDRELVEASPFDRIWGIGFGKGEAEGRRAEWGGNLLGRVLMEVRDELREELSKEA